MEMNAHKFKSNYIVFKNNQIKMNLIIIVLSEKVMVTVWLEGNQEVWEIYKIKRFLSPSPLSNDFPMRLWLTPFIVQQLKHF